LSDAPLVGKILRSRSRGLVECLLRGRSACLCPVNAPLCCIQLTAASAAYSRWFRPKSCGAVGWASHGQGDNRLSTRRGCGPHGLLRLRQAGDIPLESFQSEGSFLMIMGALW